MLVMIPPDADGFTWFIVQPRSEPPHVPDETEVLGVLKFGWFGILKNSERNSTCPPSPRNATGVSFTSEKSRSSYPGPLMKVRGSVPTNPAG